MIKNYFLPTHFALGSYFLVSFFFLTYCQIKAVFNLHAECDKVSREKGHRIKEKASSLHVKEYNFWHKIQNRRTCVF